MDFEYRKKIREVYSLYKNDLEKGIKHSPYDLGIEWEFTPIEFVVWGDIRSLGLPLYPQYPVGKYFLDFGDPFLKIGIEVDSIAWHKDLAKDHQRQIEIQRMKWRIFRIPSYLTFKSREDFEDENGDIINEEEFTNGCSEGFLKSIYDVYAKRL